ncbi:hypothetical protein SD340_004184 [Vibrio fluvialis]|nr:hypothetical protein [Vibrio fluvialis]ELU8402275.1 hypothetical protein [Vibrio fluvialis]
MKEGWFGEDHFILFDEKESALATEEYCFFNYLDGFQVVGLLGWDDFIVSDGLKFYTIPSVPIVSEYLEKIHEENLPTDLEHDERFSGKIKWYTTPIVFGGDPNSEENMVWVSHKQHRELVNYWNKQYRKAKA